MFHPKPVIWLTDTCVLATHPGGEGEDSVASHPVELPGCLCGNPDLAAVGEAIREVVGKLGLVDEPVRLVIPSTWVLIHRLDLPGRRWNETEAAYELEAYLPVALEEVTTAFMPAGDEGIWGLALPTAPIKGLVDELQDNGLLVDEITVDLWTLPRTDGTEGCLLIDRNHMTMAIQEPAGRHVWMQRTLRLASQNANQIAAQIELMERITGERRRVWRVFGQINGQSFEELGNRITLAEQAACTVEQFLRQGRIEPLARHDLRVGELTFPGRFNGVYSQVARCAALATLLGLLLGIGWWKAANDTDTAVEHLSSQEAQIYQKVYPGQPVPPAAALRLASERKKIDALTRANEPTAGVEWNASLLPIWHDLAVAIPSEARVLLQDLSLTKNEIALRGLTQDHTSAERIATSIGTVPGLTALPARSEAREGGGVEFSIRIQREKKENASSPSVSK